MKKIAAIVAVAGLTAAASAQTNSLRYAARLAGEGTWNFGSINRAGTDSNPLVFEVAVFATRQTASAGFSTGVYKCYINADQAADAVSVVEDAGNGVPASGTDGRQGVFNVGPQTQRVFTNRNAGIAGTGFRISSGADTADGSAAGGISNKQNPPIDPATGAPNPNFDSGTQVLLFRFNISVGFAGGVARTINCFTPTTRINSFGIYESASSSVTTEVKANTTVDALDINVTWVPAPSSLALLGLGGLVAGRRRR